MAVPEHATPAQGDAGMSLIETLVSLFVVGVVMTAAAAFFVSGLAHNTLQTQRQSATTLANQALEATQAVDPRLLVSGRTQAAVNALLATPGAAALTSAQGENVASGNYDGSATATSVPVVPTSKTQSITGVTYTLRTFIDQCFVTGAAPPAAPCAATGSTPWVWRVTVAVSWVPGRVSCPGGCVYSASVLVDRQVDPEFNTNVTPAVVANIAPSALATGSTRTLTVTGSNFVAGAYVDLGDGVHLVPLTNTGTSITVTWTAGPPGSYLLSVVNPDGGRGSRSLTVTPLPTVTGVAPSALPDGASTVVTLTGTGFQSGVTVTMTSGTTSALTYVSATSVKVTLRPDGTGQTSTTLTVTNPDGGSTTRSMTVNPVVAP